MSGNNQFMMNRRDRVFKNLTVKNLFAGNLNVAGRETADYIVVGTGAAGGPLMKKLSDDPKYSVLGFEAGDNNTEDPVVKNPVLAASILTTDFPELLWQGRSTDQKQLLRPNGQAYSGNPAEGKREFDWTNGRTLGGGTSINGVQYVRGTKAQWDAMDSFLGGGTEWSGAKVYDTYKQTEKFTNSPFGTAACWPINSERGVNGPVSLVARPFRCAPVGDPEVNDAVNFITSNVYGNIFGPGGQLGLSIPTVDDYNLSTTTLCITDNTQAYEMNNADQQYFRESSFTAYLGPDVLEINGQDGKGVNGRKLDLRLNATVLKLIYNNDKTKVLGVVYTRDGECYEAYAKKEVILSMGIRTAQFLQTQGIGPADVLANANVEVVVDSPECGKHLINHPLFVSVYIVPGLTPRDSPIPGNQFNAGLAFTPDTSGRMVADPTKRGYQWIVNNAFPNGLVTIPLQLIPKSEGTVEIQNGDPLKIPLVNVNYFNDTNDDDLYSFLNAVSEFDTAIKNITSPNGSAIIRAYPPSTVNETKFGNTGVVTIDFDDSFIGEVKSYLQQAHHWSSTARMGTSINTGVCDKEGKVFGMENLRLADNSILPLTSDGNMAGPGFVIGETIAKLVIADRA